MTDAPSQAAEQPIAPSIKLASFIAASLMLTGLSDALFLRHSHSIGWTAGLFYLIFLFAAVSLQPARLKELGGKLLFLLNIGLAASFIEEPSGLGVCLSIVFLAAFLSRAWNANSRHPDKLQSLFAAFPEAFSLGAAEGEALIRQSRLRMQTANLGETLKNILLPLGLAVVFALLFRAANPVFERYLDAIRIDWRPDILRLCFWTVVLPVVFLALRLRAAASNSVTATSAGGRSVGPTEPILSETIIVRSLVLFNALFLFQNALDLKFLWSGAPLPEGLTYAEYAHRGAYPLIATALLSGAFVLVALKGDGAAPSQRWARVLIAIWLAQNVLLVCSSILRTDVYIAAYSLTYLRLYALIWMGLIAVGLILIGVKMVLKKTDAWLVRANIISLIAVLYASCFADFGNLIATYNVDHCLEMSGEGPKLDTAYLRNAVGLSALPALRRYRQRVGYPPARISSNQWILTPGGSFQRVPNPEVLTDNQDQVPEGLLFARLWSDIDDWRAWTYRKYRLGKLIGHQPLIIENNAKN